MKWLLFLLVLLLIAIPLHLVFHIKLPPVNHSLTHTRLSIPVASYVSLIKHKALACKKYISQKGFSSHYVFLIDMQMPSGKNRFFIYDLLKDSVMQAGLVAHGSCRTKFLSDPQFSNVPDCGCSSIGRYKVGGAYDGRFGKAFKLFGLDTTNSNAFKREVVLHAYDCVPDKEIYPNEICNSLGCAMVSYRFLNVLASYIEASKKPILLWMYN